MKHRPNFLRSISVAILALSVCVSTTKAQNPLLDYLESLDPECTISYLIQDETGKLLAQRQPDKQIPSASIIKIPILLTLLEVAHKTGTLAYVRGDAGIIFGRRPLVISVFVEDFRDLSEAEKIIAKIGKLAYETYGK
ncbi:serine hydrolase [Cyclobacterium roseum]|uniref:serine hydrolase n=1 Tax=Cyclobacterium roseum TaxID=2666137 RepID=UPI0013908F9B|nr:serine hydrolase [Cyclobacterium roseum]